MLVQRFVKGNRKKLFGNSFTVWGSFFAVLYISLCSCDQAESVEIPSSFSRRDIGTIIGYAKSRYLSPGRINQNLSYVRAAQAALQSLPYSLLLYSKEYYKQRSRWKAEEPVISGRALFLNKRASYLIFIPDYNKWEQVNKKRLEERKKRNKKLSIAQRRQAFFTERKKQERLRKFRLSVWEKINFSSQDFRRIIAWIERNWKKYKSLPAVYKKKEEQPEKKENAFGLHKAYFSAANGFLQSIDPHCALLPQVSWQKMLSESEDSTFEGIGALLRGGGASDVVVETPLPGSPALNSGLRAGDIIRKVDGTSIEDMLLSEVVKRIRGPKETVVVLHIERPIELRNLDISIRRGVIKQLAVTNELLTDKSISPALMKGQKIGVIHIKSFLYARSKTHQLVIRAYQELLHKSNMKLDALVLDLRGNPGGYLEEAVSVADLLLPPKTTVVTIRGREQVRHLRTRKETLIRNIPLVILVNAGSASASEILASALMDHGVALVLGERSFGKATVQSVEPSVSGTVIKITSARYYAPQNYTVQVSGVVPDIKLSDEADDSFPPRFREENMWDHLPHLEKRKQNKARQRWNARLKKFVGKNTLAEKYIQAHKEDALRPDYMLIRSIAYMRALQRYPVP